MLQIVQSLTFAAVTFGMRVQVGVDDAEVLGTNFDAPEEGSFDTQLQDWPAFQPHLDPFDTSDAVAFPNLMVHSNESFLLKVKVARDLRRHGLDETSKSSWYCWWYGSESCSNETEPFNHTGRLIWTLETAQGSTGSRVNKPVDLGTVEAPRYLNTSDGQTFEFVAANGKRQYRFYDPKPTNDGWRRFFLMADNNDTDGPAYYTFSHKENRTLNGTNGTYGLSEDTDGADWFWEVHTGRCPQTGDVDHCGRMIAVGSFNRDQEGKVISSCGEEIASIQPTCVADWLTLSVNNEQEHVSRDAGMLLSLTSLMQIFALRATVHENFVCDKAWVPKVCEKGTCARTQENCCKPKTCKNSGYSCTKKSDLRLKPAAEDTQCSSGTCSDQLCCEKVMCNNDFVRTLGKTKCMGNWKPKSNFNSTQCHSSGCKPRDCCEVTCGSSGHKCMNKTWLVLSTSATDRVCTDATCTDEQCCQPVKCASNFTCSSQHGFKNKSNFVDILCPASSGCNASMCCDLVTCGSHPHQCPAELKLVFNASASETVCKDATCTNEQCCEPVKCASNFTCSSQAGWKNKSNFVDISCPASGCNASMCCDLVTCGKSAYECKDSKLVLNAAASDLPCTNATCNDDQCCKAVYCSGSCARSWLPKPKATSIQCVSPPCAQDECCDQTCKLHSCSSGWRPNTLKSNERCGVGACSDEFCCKRPTCATFKENCNISGKTDPQSPWTPKSLETVCHKGECTRDDCCNPCVPHELELRFSLDNLKQNNLGGMGPNTTHDPVMYFEDVLPLHEPDVDAILSVSESYSSENRKGAALDGKWTDDEETGEELKITGELWASRNTVKPKTSYGAVRVGAFTPKKDYTFTLKFVKNGKPHKLANFSLMFYDFDDQDGQLEMHGATKGWNFSTDQFFLYTPGSSVVTVSGKVGEEKQPEIFNHANMTDGQKAATVGFEWIEKSEVIFTWRPRGEQRLLLFNGHSLKQCKRPVCKIREYRSKCPSGKKWAPEKNGHGKDLSSCDCTKNDCCIELGTNDGFF